MADGAQLLRMLEPAVRPVAGPTTQVAPRQQPFESQSFDDLLHRADSLMQQTEQIVGSQGEASSTMPLVGERPAATAGPAATGPLAELMRIDAVENASLRQLIRQYRDHAE